MKDIARRAQVIIKLYTEGYPDFVQENNLKVQILVCRSIVIRRVRCGVIKPSFFTICKETAEMNHFSSMSSKSLIIP